MKKRVIPLALVVLALALLAGPVASQGGSGVISGSGVIRIGNPQGALNVGSFNPLRCSAGVCEQLADLLFPRLLGVDPMRGAFATAGDDESVPTALALDWQIAADFSTYTLTLRDDLTWSDGVPVTAYDVFYTFFASVSEPDAVYGLYYFLDDVFVGAVPLDAQTIIFFPQAGADCAALDALNIHIVPAHAFEPDFAADAAAHFAEAGEPLAQYEAWADGWEDRHFAYLYTHPFGDSPTATAGPFELTRVQPSDYLRLATADGALGFEYVAVSDEQAAVRGFMTGEFNLIFNPPVEDRADLRLLPDVQVAAYPGNRWDFISFNLADPREPRDAYDEDGNRQEQGIHPIFGDARVRRAVQLAINVPLLINVALLGEGTIIPANQLPTSWAYNPDLTAASYDPGEAIRLLEEAGWFDTNNNGVRECISCLYAEPDAPLSFELLYSDSAGQYRYTVANLIATQLQQVGFNVFTRAGDGASIYGTAQRQRYDAYLAGWGEAYPANPDQTALFTRSGDVIGSGANTGSYDNPRVDELLTAARTLPGCDVEARAALYREAQAILQQDQPYVWLFAPDDFVAARGGVLGFDPVPADPLWNVTEWMIVR